ncbi:MAG TPA: hypothetical protein VN541_23665 [Tepidisphaeraceae bacterium]|nr:hypothetical protein [Tepidisphaeraceae bacterium]
MPRVTPTGRRLAGTYSRSRWSHRFAAKSARDLYSLLPGILRKLEPHRAFLRKLVREKGTLELFCGVIADGNWDESFGPELLGRFAALGLDDMGRTSEARGAKLSAL